MEVTRDASGRPVCPYELSSPDFPTYFDTLTAELAEKAPLVWSEDSGGFWLATSFELVRKLGLDEEHLFIGPNGIGVPSRPNHLHFIPGEADDEAHDNYRLALNPMFTKEVVEGLRPAIEAHFARELDALLTREEFDAFNDYVLPVINSIVSKHLGFDVDDPVAFNKAIFEGHRYATGGDFPSPDIKQRFQTSWTHLVEVIKDRRANPKNDVISQLAHWKDPEFTDDEIQRMTLNVILGATDSTATLTALAILYLDRHHDARDYLTAHPERIEGAINEFLRLLNPTMHLGRTARTDFEVAGVTVKTGDRVLLSRWGANHDPKKFPNPYTFDAERDARQQVSMGVGAHACLGQWVAKAVATAALRGLLDRAPHYGIDVQRAAVREEVAGLGRWQTMPIRVNGATAIPVDPAVVEARLKGSGIH